MHPTVKLKTDIKVPKNLPNKKPAIRAIGEAKPKSKIQTITNNANAIVKLTLLSSLTSIKN